VLHRSIVKWLWVSLCLLWLAGCGDGSRVERRQLEDPDEKPSSRAGAFHGPSSPSPHGRQPAHADVKLDSPEVELGEVRLTAPKTWVRKAPRSEVIAAEFTLPRAAGDDADGRLTVSSVGGSLQENLDRWRRQFGEKPDKESQEKLEVAGVQVTVLDVSGTFRDPMAGGFHGPGGSMAATEHPGYRMLGAVLELGGRLYFVKSYGPATTMAARAEEFRAFVRSLRLARASP
jgi:hypothetical protein